MSPAFSAVPPATTPTLSLFPECPEHSPNDGATELAQLCDGPRGELQGRVPADCPPREHQAPRVNAKKMVGIASLAASSPPAVSRRDSPDRTENFWLTWGLFYKLTACPRVRVG